MVLSEIISLLLKNKKVALKVVNWLVVALLTCASIFLAKQNQRLSQSLNKANNNIEAYQGIAEGKQKENRALTLTLNELRNSNDSLLKCIESKANEIGIKTKQISTAATQTQNISVNASKGVRGDIVEIVKDTIYSDSIAFNDLTTVYYTISKDTVNIGLDISNTQYLYVYANKEYKNKKNFFKRLITFDFKKVTKTNYKIYDSNELIKTTDVRVIELTTE